jgi:cytochrome c oxidase subunit 2
MMTFILGLAVVLVIGILLMIFRVQSLIAVARGTDNERGGTLNKINAALFPIFFIVGGFLAVYSSIEASHQFLPEAASPHGRHTDFLFWLTMAIIGFVFVITHILLFYFPFKYQFSEKRRASFYPENHKLELVWTVIPAIVLAILVFTGWLAWVDITKEAPADAVVVEVMAKQFGWQVRYPGADGKLGHYNFRLIDDPGGNIFGIDFADEKGLDDFINVQEMHLPKGKRVLFKIRARDVLHSVFAPHFRVKMDAVPGMPTHFSFIPDKSTADMRAETGNPDFNYELACTEICGRGHFAMKFRIVVDEPDDYERWYAAQKPFLKETPAYLSQVPANLKEKALRIIGPVATPAPDSTAAGKATAMNEIKVLTVNNK